MGVGLVAGARSPEGRRAPRLQLAPALRLRGGEPRARPHCRVRHRWTDYLSSYGVKRMSNGATRVRATEPQGSLADVRRRLAAELGLPIDLFARRSEGRLAHVLPAKPSTRESRSTEKARPSLGSQPPPCTGCTSTRWPSPSRAAPPPPTTTPRTGKGRGRTSRGRSSHSAAPVCVRIVILRIVILRINENGVRFNEHRALV
jgi:hypothetical protein